MALLPLKNGVTWPDGTVQETAPFGAGVRYVYDTDTSNTDPGSGGIKFDNATLADITSLRISEIDDFGTDLTNLLTVWDDNGASIRSTVFMVKENDPSTYLIFHIAGTWADNGSWRSCTITYVAAGGSFADGDVVRLSYSRTGLQGLTGSTGAAGAGHRFSWYFDTGTTPPGFSGDFSGNNATFSNSTEIYLAHGTAGEGDPSVYFLELETDGNSGYFWMVHPTNPQIWQVWHFSAVDDQAAHTKFVCTLIDAQGADPQSGERWYFTFFPWPTPAQIGVTGGGDVSSNTATSVDSEIALFSGTGGKTIKRASATGYAKVASGVLSAVDAATLKGELDLETGIDIQAYDADLGVIAALSPNNDDIIQRKTGAWTNRTMAQLKTDLSLSKSDVGLGNVDNTSDATKNSATATLTNKRVTPRTGTVASSATPTINTDDVDFFSITALAADITSMTTNLSGTPTVGQKLWIAITGTATRAIAWGASFESSTAVLPTTTVGTARVDVGFIWTGSIWRCVAVA